MTTTFKQYLVDSEQLDEIKLRQALAIGAMAAAASMTPGNSTQRVEQPVAKTAQKSAHGDAALIKIVLDKYKIGEAEAVRIVKLVRKYEKPSFPKAEDILAIIGIESSFNSQAKSNLKKDPAIGLTQIRPKVWGLNPKELKGDIDSQIKMSAEILTKYYEKLGKNKDKAVHAYNIGLTNLLKGKNLNLSYVDKWKRELTRYS